MSYRNKFIFASAIVSLLAQSRAQTSYSFTENWKARNYSWATSITPKTLNASSSPAATVNVNISTLVSPVLPTQFGVNTNFRDGSDQRSRDSLYDGIITAMRFPAGSGSNTYFWDGNIPAQMNNYYDNTGAVKSVSGINGMNSNYMTPDIFIQFKNDINGQPIVVVNYFYARYGITSAGTRAARVQQAADYAAGFVRKLNIELGGKIKYWEIGNECYGQWEVGYNVVNSSIGKVTGKEYGQDFCVFAQAMKAVDPTIKIGAIVNDTDDGWNGGVLPEVQNTADFLSVHEYFTSVADATASNILAAVSQISGIKSTLNSCITKYTTKNAGYFPFVLSEFNSRGPYNCSMINGLFITQILGEVVKNGFGLSTLWVSEWSWNSKDLSTHGFLAKDDPEQADYTPRQSYIPFYYYSKCFGDYMVSSSSNSNNIKCYASTFSSGESGIVLVNTSNATKTVKLNFANNSGNLSVDKIQWYEFYANTIEPTVSGYKKFYINGATSTTTGGGPANLNAVKPYEATMPTNGVISMPAYSVFFIVTKFADVTSLINIPVNKSERIIPYYVHETCVINDTVGLQKVEILNNEGKLLFSGNSYRLFFNKLTSGLYILKASYINKQIVNRFYKS